MKDGKSLTIINMRNIHIHLVQKTLQCKILNTFQLSEYSIKVLWQLTHLYFFKHIVLLLLDKFVYEVIVF